MFRRFSAFRKFSHFVEKKNVIFLYFPVSIHFEWVKFKNVELPYYVTSWQGIAWMNGEDRRLWHVFFLTQNEIWTKKKQWQCLVCVAGMVTLPSLNQHGLDTPSSSPSSVVSLIVRCCCYWLPDAWPSGRWVLRGSKEEKLEEEEEEEENGLAWRSLSRVLRVGSMAEGDHRW